MTQQTTNSSDEDKCPKCGSEDTKVGIGISAVYCYCRDCGETIWESHSEHIHDY